MDQNRPTDENENENENILMTVAKEFGFEEEEISIVLRQHYFDMSGDLVEYLMDMFEDTLQGQVLDDEKMNEILESDTERSEINKSLEGDSERSEMNESLKDDDEEQSGMSLKNIKEMDEALNRVHERRKLRTETKDLLSERMCVTCKQEERAIVFLPCSHLALCRQCALKAVCCPCGMEIIDSILTFIG